MSQYSLVQIYPPVSIRWYRLSACWYRQTPDIVLAGTNMPSSQCTENHASVLAGTDGPTIQYVPARVSTDLRMRISTCAGMSMPLAVRRNPVQYQHEYGDTCISTKMGMQIRVAS
eukprot:2442846-Rhodomonas_salina.1